MNANINESITRRGKIARLPAAIREELNRRLQDGAPQDELIRWLNESPTVRARLAEYFQGRPITQQNLSDWKLGGFLDWQGYQATRAMTRDFLATEESGEPCRDEALRKRVTDLVALVLLRLFRAATTTETGPRQCGAALAISRELARMRRDHYREQRVRLEEERLNLQDGGHTGKASPIKA